MKTIQKRRVSKQTRKTPLVLANDLTAPQHVANSGAGLAQLGAEVAVHAMLPSSKAHTGVDLHVVVPWGWVVSTSGWRVLIHAWCSKDSEQALAALLHVAMAQNTRLLYEQELAPAVSLLVPSMFSRKSEAELGAPLSRFPSCSLQQSPATLSHTAFVSPSLRTLSWVRCYPVLEGHQNDSPLEEGIARGGIRAISSPGTAAPRRSPRMPDESDMGMA